MLKYHSNCTSQANAFDLVVTLCSVFEPKHLNAFNSSRAILATTLEEKPLEENFREQSGIASPWYVYRTKASAYGGGLELDYAMFGDIWTKCWGAHAWFNSVLEQPCECEGHK